MQVQRRTASGLILAEQGQDERATRAQLKTLDPDLILSIERHPGGGLEYVVVVGRPDGTAEVICRWRDTNGDPLPLSSGLIDHVNRLRADTRTPYEDPAVTNARIVDGVQREMEDAAADAARDVEDRHGRLPAFHRSRGLYLARQKARAKGDPWQA